MTMIGHSVADASGLLLTMDEAVANFLQRSKPELRGLSYADITHPEDRNANVSRIGLLAVGDSPLKVRKRYIVPNGEYVWATVQVSRLETNGDQGRLIGTISSLDVKLRQTPPQELWEAAKAQAQLIVQRNAVLGSDMFNDGAWSVLLCLYLAEAEGRGIDDISCYTVMGLSAVSLERWLRAFRSRGLVEFIGSGESQPQLTQRGLNKIEGLLSNFATGRTQRRYFGRMTERMHRAMPSRP